MRAISCWAHTCWALLLLLHAHAEGDLLHRAAAYRRIMRPLAPRSSSCRSPQPPPQPPAAEQSRLRYRLEQETRRTVHAGAVAGDIGPAFLRRMPALSSVAHLMKCSTCKQQQRYSSYTFQWTPGVARQLFIDDRAVESSCGLLRTVHRSCLAAADCMWQPGTPSSRQLVLKLAADEDGFRSILSTVRLDGGGWAAH